VMDSYFSGFGEKATGNQLLVSFRLSTWRQQDR